MATLDDIINRIAAIDFDAAIKDAVEETDEYIKHYQQLQMYIDGQKSDGSMIGEYKPYTIERKREKGQRYDHVTLRDEMDFYVGITVTANEKSVEITSTDWKTDKLMYKYGSDIFGLNKERASEYSLTDLAPLAIKHIVKQITG